MRDHYEDDSEEATLLGGEQRRHEREEDLHAETASQVWRFGSVCHLRLKRDVEEL